MSLSARIAIILFIAQMIVLSTIGILARHIAKNELVKTFDESLHINGEALGSLLEKDSKSGDVELEFAEEIMTRFSRKKTPDLFIIYNESGGIIEKSKSMEKIPSFVKKMKDNDVKNFRFDDRSYRGIMINVKVMEDEDPANVFSAKVFYATSREPLKEAILRLSSAIWGAFIITLIVSVLLSLIAAKQGLRPLEKFSKSFEKISPSNLKTRIDTRRFPKELIPPAKEFNYLMQRLEEAFERERRFSADVAHELRTPITSLKTSIQSSIRTSESNEEISLLKELEIDTDRLIDLCENLLMLTSPISNPYETMKIHEVADEINNVIDSFSQYIKNNGSECVFTDEPGKENWDSEVYSNRFIIQRIISNLIKNANDHAGKGIRIEISLKKTEANFIISVKDNGAGIPEEMQSRIFERFFRVDKSRSRKIGGAGLGLALCKELAEGYHGDLFYIAQEKGACFQWKITCVNQV